MAWQDAAPDIARAVLVSKKENNKKLPPVFVVLRLAVNGRQLAVNQRQSVGNGWWWAVNRRWCRGRRGSRSFSKTERKKPANRGRCNARAAAP